MMSEGIALAELHLHIGAHKTATTHLQDILAANRAYLHDNEVLYLPRFLIRQMRLLKMVNSNYRKAQEEKAAKTVSLEDVFSLKAKDIKRVLVSEENILGGSIDLLDGLYPTMNDRLIPWLAVGEPDKKTIYISIRDHADILPSAFSQALRDGANTLPFKAYLDKWIYDKPSWHDLVQNVRSLFPLATIVVWTFEKYIEGNAEILKRMTGLFVPMADLQIPEGTKSLSASAVTSIQGIDQSVDRVTRIKLIEDIVASDRSASKFNPLAVAERNELHARYVSDVDIIKKMGVEFLG